ncbi:MAG: hypothetical protein K8T26_12290 [Lentisphaerae bacterium]|nr:hypothetical protein [Lentisphaerota bacterium]
MSPSIGGVLAALLVAVACPCRSEAQPAEPQAGSVTVTGADVPAVLTDATFLQEVVRHVYRWHLDENDVDRLSGTQDFPFWVRMLDVSLDAGDHSQMAEIVMPLVGTTVTVKKPDYRIAELDLVVTSGVFRVTHVSKIGIPDAPLPAHQVVNVNYAEMKAYLFRTRTESAFPDAALLERLRVAVRRELGLPPDERTPGRHIVHMAPLSPVANEVWVYLENDQQLVRFASDIDLTNPAVWAHESLMVRAWNARRQVVTSLDEVAGSNAFMTRDQIGRALYNCIVLGQRVEINNPSEAPGGAAE